MFRKLESSDDEFYFDSFDTDFDKESDNICSDNIFSSDSDSSVFPVNCDELCNWIFPVIM